MVLVKVCWSANSIVCPADSTSQAQAAVPGRVFFMSGITLAEKREKYFRGSSRFNINETDQDQVNPAQRLCLLWPVAPAGPRYPCSKTRLLCFSCFCLFGSLELLGLLCGSFCLNEQSSPLVLSQGLVGVHGIIPVYR